MKVFKLLSLFVVSFSIFGSEQESIENFYGTYGYPSGRLVIYPVDQESVVLYISLNSGPPNYSGASMFGKATLRKNKLFHSSYTFNNEEYLCEFSISLEGEKAKIVMLTSNAKCDFRRYGLDGKYTRISKIPESEVMNIFTEEVCPLENIAEQFRETNEVRINSYYDCIRLKKSL